MVQTVEHTLLVTVGTVTAVALSSLERLADRVTPGDARDDRAPIGPRAAWGRRADVRANVPVTVLLEPRAEAVGAWLVVDASGTHVPWGDTPIVLAESLPAGRHALQVVFVARDGAESPPTASVRLEAAGRR